MATEIWIAIAASAAATAVIIVVLLLVIHWAVGRGVRSEIGATIEPILDLANRATGLVDQAHDTQRDLQARLDEVSNQARAFDESLEHLRSQAERRSAEFAAYAIARRAEIQESAEQAHEQIVQTLDVMSWTEQEAANLVDALRCLQEEFHLEQQVRSVLSGLAADLGRSGEGVRLAVGRITTDSPFLDFVARVDGEPPRYLSIQIKALGDRSAADALRSELERAAVIQSAMPGDALITTLVVVNRLPDRDGVAELIAGLDGNGVELVPVDEFSDYARSWIGDSRESE